MVKYRKKPVIIEAMLWDNSPEVLCWIADNEERDIIVNNAYEEPKVTIHTLEGDMVANFGDYIIKGISGELYPCKPDIFEMTYEKVD